MTNTEFAKKAINIAKNYKTLYVMGCFGAPLNKQNRERYKSNHYYNSAPDRVKLINKATEDTFGFDCVCLIKAILWGWKGSKTDVYGGAKYASNGVPDTDANGMISLCKGVSTNFKNIEIGEVVWMEDHIGIYIGNGLAVECTPSFKNKVQITAVENVGGGTVSNSRRWKKHGKLPFVTYKKATADKKAEPAKKTKTDTKSAKAEKPADYTPKIGDKVKVNGNIYYSAGGGKTLKKNNETMYVIEKVKKDLYKYYVGVAISMSAPRQGWCDPKILTKIK